MEWSRVKRTIEPVTDYQAKVPPLTKHRRADQATPTNRDPMFRPFSDLRCSRTIWAMAKQSRHLVQLMFFATYIDRYLINDVIAEFAGGFKQHFRDACAIEHLGVGPKCAANALPPNRLHVNLLSTRVFAFPNEPSDESASSKKPHCAGRTGADDKTLDGVDDTLLRDIEQFPVPYICVLIFDILLRLPYQGEQIHHTGTSTCTHLQFLNCSRISPTSLRITGRKSRPVWR